MYTTIPKIPKGHTFPPYSNLHQTNSRTSSLLDMTGNLAAVVLGRLASLDEKSALTYKTR